jgi:hypothetical protein
MSYEPEGGAAYPERDSNAHWRRPERRASAVGLPGRGAGGGTRTRCLPITSRLHDLSCCAGVVRALGAIRTRTVDVLNVGPLPLGYEGEKLRAEDSNLQPPGPEPGVLPDCTSPHRPAGEVMGLAGRSQRRDSAAQVGTVGAVRRGMRASDGVRSPLRWLQPPQAATVLSQVLAPPRERGSTWSMVEAVRPQ